MSISLYPPSQPRTMAELLETSFKIFRVSLLKCLPYATLAILANLLPVFYDLTHGHLPEPRDLNDPVWVTLSNIGGLLAVILCMATLLRQSTVAAGRTPNRADLLDVLRNSPAIIAIWLLLQVALAVPFLVALTLPGPYRLVGFTIMIVPATYILVALSLSLPARMLARKGVFQSLAYSMELVRGNWWRVAGMYGVGVAVTGVFGLLMVVMAGIVMPAAGDTAPVARAVMSTVILAVLAIGLTVLSAIWLTVFGDLEVRKIPRPR